MSTCDNVAAPVMGAHKRMEFIMDAAQIGIHRDLAVANLISVTREDLNHVVVSVATVFGPQKFRLSIEKIHDNEAARI